MISIFLKLDTQKCKLLFLRYLILCLYSELFQTTVYLEKANKANDHGSCRDFKVGQVLDVDIVVVSADYYCQAQPKRDSLIKGRILVVDRDILLPNSTPL